MDTTFYYGNKPSELFHLKCHCTIWMPETLPPDSGIWNPGQVIATCDFSYLSRLKAHIQAGILKPDKVIWIEIKSQTATGYIFAANGTLANFFRIV